MRILISIILLLLFNIQFLLADKIDLEVYLTTEHEGNVYLNVDGKDIGTIPIVVKDIQIGYHKFKIMYVDENGNIHTNSKNINVTLKDNRIFLSTSKVSKGGVPFICGFFGGVAVFWLIFSKRFI